MRQENKRARGERIQAADVPEKRLLELFKREELCAIFAYGSIVDR